MRDRRQPNALQMPVGETLSPRAREVLRLLVERHIASGKPVGSRTLVETGSLDVSPATVRSVLSDLEAEGYLRAPHTSAGRVPTEQAYRLYVDELLAQGVGFGGTIECLPYLAFIYCRDGIRGHG